LVQVWSRHRRRPGSPPQCGCGGGVGAVVDSVWTAWRSDEGAYVPRLEISLARRRPCCPACMHLYTSAPLLIYVFKRCYRPTSLQRQCSRSAAACCCRPTILQRQCSRRVRLRAAHGVDEQALEQMSPRVQWTQTDMGCKTAALSILTWSRLKDASFFSD